MRTKALSSTAVPDGKLSPARSNAPRRPRAIVCATRDTSTVPPLQWWRHLPADAYTAAHLQTLHRAISGIGMIGEPRWADAARGQSTAAVAVALQTINNRTTPKPVLDLSMSTVLIAAINGSTSAITLLKLMIGRMAANDAERERLQRSWSKANRADRRAAAHGGEMSRGE